MSSHATGHWEKHPDAVSKHTLSFANVIDTGVTLLTVSSVTAETLRGGTGTVTITPGDSDSPVVSGDNSNMVTFFAGGGNAREKYDITVTVTTSDGQTLPGIGTLEVEA